MSIKSIIVNAVILGFPTNGAYLLRAKVDSDFFGILNIRAGKSTSMPCWETGDY